MWDKIFAVLSIAGLFLFFYVVMSFVAEPNLWVVMICVSLVAAYFFWREYVPAPKNDDAGNRDDGTGA